MRLSPKLPTIPVSHESEILPLESPSCGSQVFKLLSTSNRYYTWDKQYLKPFVIQVHKRADIRSLKRYGTNRCPKQRRKQ